jgi:RNA polymerase sigma-70 factor (ECF subfamily)
MELPANGPTPEQQHADNDLALRVRRAVATLPLGQRQVVTLVDLEELSYGAAAQALGIPVGTVMSRLSRARLALRDLLHESPAALHVLPAKTRSGQ